MAYRTYSITNGFIVSLDGTGDFKDINSALAAAPANTVIGLKPGIYAPGGGGSNNLIKNVTICGMPGAGFGESVVIQNRFTVENAGTYTLANIYLDSTYDFSFVSDGGFFATVNIIDCYFNSSIASISSGNPNCTYNLYGCRGDLINSSASIINGSGVINFYNTIITNSGNSTVIPLVYANVLVENSSLYFPFDFVGGGSCNIFSSTIDTSAINITPFTLTTGTSNITNSLIQSGTARAIVANSPLTIHDLVVNCNNAIAAIVVNDTNLSVNLISFSGTQSNIQNNGGTIIALPNTMGSLELLDPLEPQWGGTGLTSPGASGNVLTSNGSAWVSQAPGGSGPQSINVQINNINFKNTGGVKLYTPPVGYNFIITNVASYYTSVASPVSDAQFSYGVTGSAYTDYCNNQYVISGESPTTPAVGIFSVNAQNYSSTFIAPAPFSTNSSPIYANINTGAVATTAIGTLIISGILVPQ